MATDIKTEIAALMTAQGLNPQSIPLNEMSQGALISVKEHLVKHDNVTSIEVQPSARPI